MIKLFGGLVLAVIIASAVERLCTWAEDRFYLSCGGYDDESDYDLY